MTALTKHLTLITHLKMCTFSLTGLLFVSSLLHPGLVCTIGFPAFPLIFKRTLPVSSKVRAVFEKYSDQGSITEISLCMPGLHRIKFMDTRQVCEYPDSTVLTVLKWRMITMLNMFK